MNLRRPSLFALLTLAAFTVAPAVAEAGSSRRARRPAPIANNGTTSSLKSDESVQAALAATAAGGLLRLPFGSYRTAIVIDRPMTVVADPRGTRLDAKGLGRPAIEVVAGVTGVTIDGVVVSAADTDGVAVGAGCDGLRLTRSTFERNGGDGLHVARSADVRIEGCVFDRNAGDGLDLDAVGGVVTGCTFRENGGAAVRLAGTDVTLTTSSSNGGAEGVVFEGLRIAATRVTFRGTRVLARFAATSDTCALERCDGRDVTTLATTEEGSTYARIVGNRVAGTAGDAVLLRGTWHTVEGNALGRVLGSAVVGDGLSLRVAENTTLSAAANGVRMSGMGDTVEGNVLGPCGADALVVDGVAHLVARNVVRDGNGSGLVLDGEFHQAVANRITNVPGAGIRLEGDDCLVEGNRLERAGLEGIVVAAGRANQLRANAIARCGGRGLADDGIDTVLERNRID
ncbi:MAG: right-handed parallel beta-helix repeat-containing protein [Planctomycetota bacterium]